jgi:hypothetical protein
MARIPVIGDFVSVYMGRRFDEPKKHGGGNKGIPLADVLYG